jgi:hypothetical protein
MGGNSPRAIRRTVELGDAWYPVFTLGAISVDKPNLAITDDAELARRIRYMQDYSAQIGRARPPEVQVIETVDGRGPWSVDLMVERFGKLHELGVAGISVAIQGKNRAEWLDNAERYADVFRQFPAARADSA